jgi:hypothetical protein
VLTLWRGLEHGSDQFQQALGCPPQASAIRILSQGQQPVAQNKRAHRGF